MDTIRAPLYTFDEQFPADGLNLHRPSG